MDNRALVSIIIPTYRRNDDLIDAVRSAIEQTYTPVEVIVVDDSGEEYARPVMDQFEDVTYVPLENNRGPQNARKVGLELSSGSYVQFLDDDDSLFPEKLERQIPVLEQNAEVGVVYCGLEWEHGPEVLPKEEVRGDVVTNALRFDTSPCMMGTMLIERSILAEVSMDRHEHGADDIGLKIDLALATAFDYVDEVLVRRGNTTDSRGASWAAVDGRFEVLETYADVYRKYPARVRREALAETHLVKGQRHLQDRSWSPEAVRAFAKAAYYAPGFDSVYVSSFIFSLLGRKGYDLSRSLYSRHVLGPARRGKST